MKSWIIYALLSMVFAGFTSVIAKKDLAGISGELGLTVRTLFVVVFVLGFVALSVPARSWHDLKKDNLLWLALSGAATAASWMFYYKALKEGEVSVIALIDKGSVLVAVILAALVLKEAITLRTLAGAALMISGMLVIARK